MVTLSSLLVVVVLGVVVLHPSPTHGCSEPQGWESLDYIERIKQAEVLILGTFTETRNVTRGPGGASVEVHFDTQVHCVLKNELNLNLASTIDIVEMSGSAAAGMCVSNLYSANTGSKKLVFIQERSQGEGYEFANVNVQGAIDNYDSSTLERLTSGCDHTNSVLDPHQFTGSQCPNVAHHDHCSSAPQVALSAVGIIATTLLAIIAVYV